MIYFIRSPAGPIKIGTTIRLSQRLKQLVAEHGDGLEVLAIVDGSYDEEKALHRRFGHLRTVGEWFEPGDDLTGFIVSDGRPWDGRDDQPLGPTVRFEADLVSMAKYLAALRGTPVAKLVSDLLRPALEKEMAKEGKRFINKDKEMTD